MRSGYKESLKRNGIQFGVRPKIIIKFGYIIASLRFLLYVCYYTFTSAESISFLIFSTKNNFQL